MRPFLQEVADLTVVTNDLATVQAFLDHPGVDLICIGGRLLLQPPTKLFWPSSGFQSGLAAVNRLPRSAST